MKYNSLLMVLFCSLNTEVIKRCAVLTNVVLNTDIMIGNKELHQNEPVFAHSEWEPLDNKSSCVILVEGRAFCCEELSQNWTRGLIEGRTFSLNKWKDICRTSGSLVNNFRWSAWEFFSPCFGSVQSEPSNISKCLHRSAASTAARQIFSCAWIRTEESASSFEGWKKIQCITESETHGYYSAIISPLLERNAASSAAPTDFHVWLMVFFWGGGGKVKYTPSIRQCPLSFGDRSAHWSHQFHFFLCWAFCINMTADSGAHLSTSSIRSESEERVNQDVSENGGFYSP